MPFNIFDPAPRQVPPMPGDATIHIPSPHKLKDEAQTSGLRKALPFLIIGVLVAMIVVMLASGMFSGGNGRSPMMMMRMMMMAMILPAGMMLGGGMMGGQGSSGNTVAELNQARRNYVRLLGQVRKSTHRAGKWVHALCQVNYPDPGSLLARVGSRDMWQSSPDIDGTDDAAPGERLTVNPYMTARVGTGLVPLVPRPTADTQEILDNLEPVTAKMFHRFKEVQSVVADCGVGIALNDADVHALRGDADRRLSLARAMICSLAYNHVPGDLQIGVISDVAESEWGWMKWLPHVADTDRRHDGLLPRLAWRSLADFYAGYATSIEDRVSSNGADATHLIVVVDLPDTEVAWIPGKPARIPGVSFLVVRAGVDRISSEENWWKVNDRGLLDTASALAFAVADEMTRTEARRFATALGSYVPRGFGQMSGAAVREAASQVAVPGIFDSFGIKDFEGYDTEAMWERNRWTKTLDAPFGNRFDHDKGVRLPIVETLNIIEDALGGTGPHGFIQGVSGSGKSVLLRAYIIAMATLYPASKVRFILMDYKGGSTFFGFENLPHTIANISNLKESSDLTERMIDVIKGELERRQELINRFKKYGIVDIHGYREARRSHMDEMPELPYLVLVIDEFREAKEADKATLTVLFSIAARGRSLGMHILACSQFIDIGLVGELKENATYGISLKSNSSPGSQLVVKSTKPINITRNGEAIINKLDAGSNRVTHYCMAFDVTAPYIRRVGGADDGGLLDRDATAGMADVLSRFTLLNRPGELTEKAAEVADAHAVPTDRQIISVMLEKLSEVGRRNPAQMETLWQPPLSIPLTLGELPVGDVPDDGTLPVRIGDTDVPYEHARHPYEIDLTDGTGHIRVVGRPRSGRSTVIASMVMSSLLRYGDRICWYLVEYSGSKLTDVMGCPNVGGYAARTDDDLIERFLGEFRIIKELRIRMMGQYKLSLEQYLAAKRDGSFATTATPADAAEVAQVDRYGHMVLTLDGYQAMIQADEAWKVDKISWLLADGGSVGLHLIVTVNISGDIPPRIESRFSSTVQLAVDDHSQAIPSRGTLRTAIDAIPKAQPGRCADIAREKPALVAIPMFAEPIATGTDESGRNTYNPRTDYSAQTRAACDELRGRLGGTLAPAIVPAPDRYEFEDMWRAYGPHVNHDELPFRRMIPLGISATTLRLSMLSTEQQTTHLMIGGDRGTGKTSVLRSVAESVTRLMTPKQAQIMVIDPAYSLMEDYDLLTKRGYGRNGGYAVSPDEATKLVENLTKIITKRAPDASQMDPDMRRNRSWFSGPDIFVFIDNYHQIRTPAFAANNPYAALESALRSNPACGVHFVVSLQAANLSQALSSDKLLKALVEQRAPLLMLSGSESEGTMWSRGPKFTRRRAGRALLITAGGSAGDGDVVQTAFLAPPGGEDTGKAADAAPPPAMPIPQTPVAVPGVAAADESGGQATDVASPGAGLDATAAPPTGGAPDAPADASTPEGPDVPDPLDPPPVGDTAMPGSAAMPGSTAMPGGGAAPRPGNPDA